MRANLIAALLVCLAWASAGRAQTTLVDTFGAANTFTGAGTVGGTAVILNAVRFTVPAGPDLTVIHIDMALAVSGSVTSAKIGIFNESGNLPVGMPIASADIPGPLNSSLAFSSTAFPATATLAAGHNYWVAPYITGSGSIFWGAGLSGSVPAAYFNGATWAAQSPLNPLSIRVVVGNSQVPCCNARGTGGCLLLTPTDCATIGGIANPASTTCAAAGCSLLGTGACCRGVTCSINTSFGCLASGPAGRFLGISTSCAPVSSGGPNPCCPADFNNSGAVSVQDIFTFLQSWFAGCP